MTEFWILILIYSTMYAVEPGRRWVSAQSLEEQPVYQPVKELSVEIGDSATLRCCVSETVAGIIVWFKQPNRQKPQYIVTVYKSTGDFTFYDESHKLRFRIERNSNCISTTILNTIQSDEAMYYCALRSHSLVFADGTYLKIKGETVTTEPETFKPTAAQCNNSVHEATLHGNNINIISQTVLGLGSALGFCALLILFLAYFLLRRTKSEQIKTSTEKSGTGEREEYEAEMLNYAAVQFSKKNSKPEKRENGSSVTTECVYSNVKKSTRLKINDS